MLITFTFGGGSSACLAGGAAEEAAGAAEAVVSTVGVALTAADGVASARGGEASVMCGGADSDGCFEHATTKKKAKSRADRIDPRVPNLALPRPGMHPPPVRRLALVGALVFSAMTACGGHAPAPAKPSVTQTTSSRTVFVRRRTASMQAPSAPPERWFFEWLSRDGKRALLRRIDGRALSPMQTRVVDVDTGAMLEEAPLEELGRLPSQTLGGDAKQTDGVSTELDAFLRTPAFSADLLEAAQLASPFPFGSCSRFSAATSTGAIAFNAGDWIYVADKTGKVKKRLANEASYDPRFTPDGKHLLFRRVSGKLDKVLAKYELFVVPSDLSAPPRALPGTAGTRDRFVVDAENKTAIAIASHEPQLKTCAISFGLKPPFAAKKLTCLDGGEPLVDSVLSPHGKWAAITTQRADDQKWHLRVVSLPSGKVVLDEPAEIGFVIRAISDEGLLVQSGPRGMLIDDVQKKTRRRHDVDIDVGHRGFFRNATELVYVKGASVAVLDLGS